MAKADKKFPVDEKELQAALDELKGEDAIRHQCANLDDVFLGFCLAKGLTARTSLNLVRENSVRSGSVAKFKEPDPVEPEAKA